MAQSPTKKALTAVKRAKAALESVDWLDKELRCNDTHMHLDKANGGIESLIELLQRKLGG